MPSVGEVLARYLQEMSGESNQDAHPRASDNQKEAAIRKFTASLVGAAALAVAGLVLLRQSGNRTEASEAVADKVPPGETVAGEIRLEKLRELGI